MSTTVYVNVSGELTGSAKERKGFLHVALALPVAATDGKVKLADGPRQFRLAANQADFQVTFPGYAAGKVKLILIRSTKNLTVKKNSSGGEAWTIEKFGTKDPGFFACGATNVTSLYLTNLEGEAADVEVMVAGDS